jgi:hypothetical protein
MKKAELLKIAKPILFNTDMVRAILDGRKTVTRRVIKFPEGMTGRLSESGATDHIFYPGGIKRPLYRTGDILYVRETWCYENHMHDLTAGEPDLPNGESPHRYVYRASSPDYPVDKWKPSIHMPKTAARIFLKVTDIRVERLQDITVEQAIKEGFNSAYEFNVLWDKTIKKQDLDKYGWNANPWVWVYEFEREETNND